MPGEHIRYEVADGIGTLDGIDKLTALTPDSCRELEMLTRELREERPTGSRGKR